MERTPALAFELGRRAQSKVAIAAVA
jgi:hypothetical protein